jgi:hypothetical protein
MRLFQVLGSLILFMLRGKMTEYRSRQELRNQVIQAFAGRDEVYKIILFGKEAAGKADAYSDIDIIVYSNDPEKTWRHYRETFSAIAPVVGTYPLGSAPDYYAEMLLLDGFSPYQKIDFSIGVGLNLVLTSIMTVYECPEKGTQPVSSLPVIETHYDVVYYLADLLFSIPRFTKCLFRQDIDLYRRWNGAINRALVLMFERKFGWEAETRKSKLVSYEIERLMACLSAEERQQVHAICPPDGKVDIAHSFLKTAELIVMLSREKANALGVALDEGIIEIFQSFLREEVARFLQVQRT